MHTMFKNLIWVMPACALVIQLQGRGSKPPAAQARAVPVFPPLAGLVHAALPPPATRLAGVCLRPAG